MPVFRTISLIFVLAALMLSGPAAAQGFMAVDKAAGAGRNGCLNRAEQRTAVAGNKAVPLAIAIKSLRERGRRADARKA